MIASDGFSRDEAQAWWPLTYLPVVQSKGLVTLDAADARTPTTPMRIYWFEDAGAQWASHCIVRSAHRDLDRGDRPRSLAL